MSDEIVKYSNQFNNQALRKFTALDLDLLMAIASRVRAEYIFSKTVKKDMAQTIRMNGVHRE